MKNLQKPISLFSGLFLLTILFINQAAIRSSGSPGGRSGAPGDGSRYCTQCHSTYPLTYVEDAISTNIPESGYKPGETYTISATITQGNRTKYGFEIKPESNLNEYAGTLIPTDATTKLINVTSGQSITHNAGTGHHHPDGSGDWTFDWTAPEAGTGMVTFYGAFNAANRANGSGNDSIFNTELVIPEATFDIWTGLAGDNDWNNDNNWLDLSAPTSNDSILLNDSLVATPFTININSNATFTNLIINDADIELIISENITINYSSISGNGNITLNEGASLVPNTGTTGNVENTLNFKIIRNKPNSSIYYNFWSTPVVSGNTNMLQGADNIYELAPGAGEDASFWTPFAGLMTNGKGYAATSVSLAEFSGTVNNGDILIAVEENSGADGGNINMIGNPYPSAISASEFVADNAGILSDATIHIYDQTDRNTRDVNANFIAVNNSGASAPYNDRREQTLASTSIASCQGFQVLVNANGNVSFENDQRNGNNSDFKSGTDDKTLKSAEKIWLSVKQEKTTNHTLIAFGEQASTSIDFYYDTKEKIRSEGVQITSITKGTSLKINALPLTINDYIIPLSVTVGKGDFEISCSDTLNFKKYETVYLNDTYTGENYILESNKPIIFDNNDANSWQDRFRLTFLEKKSTNIKQLKTSENLYTYSMLKDALRFTSLHNELLNISVFNSNGSRINEYYLYPYSVKNIALIDGLNIITVASKSEKKIIKINND